MKQIETFIRHWPRTVFLMLAGALAGYVLWMFLPQEYNALTKLSISIDYNRTGKLDDLEEDRLIGVTEDILHSEAVMRQVFEKSSAETYEDFFARTRTFRTNDTWSLAVTGKDPQEIAASALLWLDKAYEMLQDAQRHAFLAEAYQNELDGLTRCVAESAEGVISSGCSGDPETLSQPIESYTQSIQEELQASHGLSTAIRIGQKHPERIELRAASRTAALSTILGAFCGLIISLAICMIPKGSKKA